MKKTAGALALAYVASFSFAMHAQGGPAPSRPGVDDGPQLNGAMLTRPASYREWVFLSSGIGMTYAPGGTPAGAPQLFDNVYVNPAAYRGFLETGRWPDHTIFILEQRASATEGSIVTGGRFQTRLAGMEAHVKDARLPGGWAFYAFGGGGQLRDAVAPLSGSASAACVECHARNTAVEETFVQFYPTLLDVARAKGTLKPGY